MTIGKTGVNKETQLCMCVREEIQEMNEGSQQRLWKPCRGCRHFGRVCLCVCLVKQARLRVLMRGRK